MLRVAEHWEKTDTGRQRRANEDALFARAPLFAVADGMGGARAGEVASRIVVETLRQGMPDEGSSEEQLAALAREANQRIHQIAHSDEKRAGMGTTLTAAYVGDGDVAFAHVGDSRAYRLRDGGLERLTDDHSLVEELRKRGKLTEAEAEEHPQRSVITRALGPEAAVEVDSFTHGARPGDIFLLCSDGLTSMVEQRTIVEILRESESLDEAGQRLIDAANDRGGRDNITVVLFRLEEVGAPAEADQPTQVGSDAPSAAEVREAATTPPPARLRRTMPLPPRPGEPADPGPRRRRGRGLAVAVVAAAVLAAVVIGGWTASRAVFFVGTNQRGFLTIYRGVPYEGPVGVRLYQDYYVSGVAAAELPSDRRGKVLDHRLRSQRDATDLVRKLERGEVSR